MTSMESIPKSVYPAREKIDFEVLRQIPSWFVDDTVHILQPLWAGMFMEEVVLSMDPPRNVGEYIGTYQQ